jgi:hypothetical protein
VKWSRAHGVAAPFVFELRNEADMSDALNHAKQGDANEGENTYFSEPEMRPDDVPFEDSPVMEATGRDASKPDEKPDFFPDVPSADALDLAAVIAQYKDDKRSGKRKEDLALEAEVMVPGLPNGKGGQGVKCKVKRFSTFEQGQIAWKSRQGAGEPDDASNFEVPEELSSPDARAGWWRSIWRLWYGLTDSTKRLLAVVLTEGQERELTLQHLIKWQKRADSTQVIDPLLEGINLLNYYAKQNVPNVELDGVRMEEAIVEQMTVAYRNGELGDFLRGNAVVVGGIVNKARLYAAIQGEVREQDAALYARHNKQAIKEAVREIMAEMWTTEGGLPLATANISPPQSVLMPQSQIAPPKGPQMGD